MCSSHSLQKTFRLYPRLVGGVVRELNDLSEWMAKAQQ